MIQKLVPTALLALVRRWMWSSRHTAGRLRSMLRSRGIVGFIKTVFRRTPPGTGYSDWIKTREYQPSQLPQIRVEIASFPSRPFFTLFFIPGKDDALAVQIPLDSIDRQIYPDFEVIFVAGRNLPDFIKKQPVKTLAQFDLGQVIKAAQGSYCAFVNP